MTLSLPRALLKKAKVAAARQEKSLSEMLKEALEEKVSAETGYAQAKKRQLNLMNKGLALGTKGRIAISREELHAR